MCPINSSKMHYQFPNHLIGRLRELGPARALEEGTKSSSTIMSTAVVRGLPVE
jgi:hypothetical protein